MQIVSLPWQPTALLDGKAEGEMPAALMHDRQYLLPAFESSTNNFFPC